MRFKEANDAFREEWNVVPNDITKTDKGLLKQMLDNTIESYKSQNISDLDKYYFAFVECIENVFPDEPWYENIGLDIRMDLFNTRSPQETAQHIVDALTDADAYVEENKVLTEDTIQESNGKWTNRGNKGTKNFEEKFLSEGYDVTDRFSRLLSRYDNEIDVIPEENVYDYSHFKLVKSADDAEKVDYRSDYWGSANSYREEILDFMSRLEPMIGGVYSDEDGDSYKIVGLLIDKQYTSLSNCYVLVKDVVSGESLKEDTVKNRNGNWTNRGNSGKEHGEFKTKKEADAQRKAMYANGYNESYTSNRRLDILFDIVDDSFPEVGDDMLREDFITEAIRLTSIPGVKRDPSNDFSDDGNRFTAYIYKDTVPISYLKSNGEIYLTIAFHDLPDINSDEYRKFDSYKVADAFNGVSESSYNADVFAKNLELAYNDILNFRNNIEDVDEDEIDKIIEQINKSCKEYKEKVKNYLSSRTDKIMSLTPAQFTQLQRYVKDAGSRTADYIKDLNQASKRHILSQDINDLKRTIANTWNFKYIEELIG